MNKYIILLILFLIISVFSCKKEFKDKKVLVSSISADTLLILPGNNEVYFTSPRHLALDSAGNIYVADRAQTSLLKFSPDGSFISKIGRRGPGPAEFRNIKGFTIRKDTLIVFDRSAQMFKLFSTSGELIATHAPPHTISFEIKFLRGGSKNILFFVNETNYDQPTLLNYYSKNYDSLYSGSLFLDQLGINIDVPVRPFLGELGSFERMDEQTIYFAPRLYSGELFKLRFDPLESAYKIERKVEGHVIKKQPISIVKGKNSGKRVDVRVMGRGFENIKGAVIHNESLAMFRLSTGELIHFTSIETQDNRRQFGVEVFEKDKLKGYGVLQTKEITGDGSGVSNQFLYRIHWKDKDDNFYSIYKEEVTKFSLPDNLLD